MRIIHCNNSHFSVKLGMYRKIIHQLNAWKNNTDRKPLFLLGARQVGKTWALHHFGKSSFPNYHYVDFSENSSKLSEIFQADTNTESLLKNLELYLDKTIDIKTDLLIFDEIQAEPKAIKSLKFFNQNYPQLAIACAGSLLGIGLSNESFPVGKVNYLYMYPISFEEFVHANSSDIVISEFQNIDYKKEIPIALHQKLNAHLKEFWVTGGMPEAVLAFVNHRDHPALGYQKAREVQNRLLLDYNNDFGKHAGKINAGHIRSVFKNIPIQISKNINGSVQRYFFKDVIPGKKGYSSFEGPIEWLIGAGLIYKVPVCNRSEIPLKSFTQSNLFKLHLFDIGLLGASLELPPALIVQNNYGITKGYFAEAYVLSELKKNISTEVYSWSESNAEIEYLFSSEEYIVPLEVKASHRTKAKSLIEYIKKYNPPIALKIMDVSYSPFRKEGVVWHIPLYMAGQVADLVRDSAFPVPL